MTIKFLSPFADSGDKSEIPAAIQGDGSLSRSEGWGFDYSRNPSTDPAAKRIDRGGMNWLFWAITSALGQIQQTGAPEWITAADNGGTAYPYEQGAIVRHGGGTYASLIADNAAAPGSDPAKWLALDWAVMATHDWVADYVQNHGFVIPALPAAASAADDDILAIANDGGVHRKIMVADLFAGRGGVDQLARDQIALTNLRQILATSVSTGALVQGKQWEFSTDEWGASSTGATYVAGPPGYYTNLTTYNVTPTGTAIGNMTDNVAMAAAFSGTDYKTLAATPYKYATSSAWIGWDWTAPPPANITKVELYSTSDQGFKHQENPSVTFTVRETAAGPGYGVGPSLGTATVTDSNSQKVTINLSSALSLQNTTIDVSGGSSTYSLQISKIVFVATSGADMTLAPPALTIVPTTPAWADLYFLWKDDSGAAAPGTDLIADLGRAEGAWTPAEISVLAAYDGSYSLLRARANLSGQTIGTSLTGRIKTLNGKAQRVAAPALYAE